MTLRITALLSFVPSMALAHPGHGTTAPESWTHYLTEPVHVAVAAAIAVGAVALGTAWRRTSRRDYEHRR